jgi:hypothetical protein
LKLEDQNLLVIQCDCAIKLDKLKLSKEYWYSINGRILDINSILQKGYNFVRFQCRIKGEKLEFPNIILPIFVVFTDANHLINVKKVDLIGYDPAGRIIKDLIVEATNIETKCKFTLLEIKGRLSKD